MCMYIDSPTSAVCPLKAAAHSFVSVFHSLTQQSIAPVARKAASNAAQCRAVTLLMCPLKCRVICMQRIDEMWCGHMSHVYAHLPF